LLDIAPDLVFSDTLVLDPASITIKQEIGRGGFGVVYQGIWKNVEVAVKELLPEANDDIFEDFKKEVSIMRYNYNSILVYSLFQCIKSSKFGETLRRLLDSCSSYGA
jgi:serine/threonine protein kinase